MRLKIKQHKDSRKVIELPVKDGRYIQRYEKKIFTFKRMIYDLNK